MISALQIHTEPIIANDNKHWLVEVRPAGWRMDVSIRSAKKFLDSNLQDFHKS